MARGNYIYPPEPTMRLTTDIFEYCHENVPKWNTISISGYHIREKGCSAVQEVAFTLSNAIAYVEAALERGPRRSTSSPRGSPSSSTATTTSSRRSPSSGPCGGCGRRSCEERFGANDENSQMIRFHTQTGGVTLQAQQPEVNIIRVALQGFAAVAGGTQSLHTNGFDEALALPTERSARIALRTQQVLAHESGRRRHRRPVRRLLLHRVAHRRDRGALLGADGEGRGAGRLGRGARVHPARDRGVGDLLPRALPDRPGHHRRRQQVRHRPGRRRRHPQGRPRVRAAPARAPRRSSRRAATRPTVDERLEELRDVARGDGNLLHPIKEALRAGASIGEVCGAMRDVFGEYRGGAFF